MVSPQALELYLVLFGKGFAYSLYEETLCDVHIMSQM